MQDISLTAQLDVHTAETLQPVERSPFGFHRHPVPERGDLTIGEFVDWCHQGLGDAGVSGEILIVDSSTDRTAEIAVARRRAGAARPQARPRARLHRRAAATSAATT